MTYEHEHDGLLGSRQEYVDHMVQVHNISPTHFRDKNDGEVGAIHGQLHVEMAQRSRAAWDHPQHYGGADNPYETIKVLAAWMTPEQLEGFCIGNAIKYISRAGKKDPDKRTEDLEKARWYLDYSIQRFRSAE